MKKLILLLFLGGFVFTACQKDDLNSVTELDAVQSRGGNGVNNASAEIEWDDCDPEPVKKAVLYAGQFTPAGEVEVELVDGTYNFTYTAYEGFCFSEIHFTSFADKGEGALPLNGNGNPNPGGFDYKNDELDGGCVTTFSESVASKGLYIAAHAVVNCIVTTKEDVLAEIPSTLTLQVDRRRDIPGSDQNFYWDITLNDDPFNSEYGAYCVDPSKSLGAGTYANTAVYLATDWASLPEGLFTSPQNFPAVNYLLNQDIIGNGYTYGDLQVAIWTLVSTGVCCLDIIGPYDQTRVDQLVTDALANLAYVPDCDDFMGVILVPPSNKQPIIFKFKLNCGGEPCDETAWGRNPDSQCPGNLPGANWATYFIYDDSMPE